MGADAIMEYQYSVIATIRDILWGGKKAASRPEYLTIIIILSIAPSSIKIQAKLIFLHFYYCVQYQERVCCERAIYIQLRNGALHIPK